MIKAILFDLDGVLIETEKETFHFYQKYLKENFNIILKDEDFKYKAGRKSKDFFNDVLSDEEKKLFDPKELTEKKRELFNTQMDTFVKKILGGKELILELKEKGYKLALVSQNESRMINNVMKWLEIENLFDVVLSLDDITKKKPDPQIYEIAREKLGLEKNECIVIEDSYDGIAAAKNGGFKCIALYHNYMPKNTYDKADITIEKLDEIKNYL